MSRRFRFVNLDGTGPQPLDAVLKWAVVDKVLGRRRSDDVPAATPRADVNVALLARPPGVGEPVRLTWLGHASWLVQLDGVSLLVDPVFSESIGPGVHRQVPAALDVGQLPYVDGQLVTRNHRDHLDLPSLRAVARPVIGGLGLAPFFKRYNLECTFFAMHHGTFKLTDEPLAEPPQRLAAEWLRRALDPVMCHVLPIGGTQTVPAAVG